MNCPRCAAPMQTHLLDGHLGREVQIDVCAACQSAWFDTRENLQLTPGATLSMFRLIGERGGRPSPHEHDLAKCPRCQAKLRRTHDMQRATRFEYFRCPNDHGRFITFFNFLKEKDFIKPLTPAQIVELRSSVDTVNCSNCGAPVDLAKGSVCSHCGAALSMLDLQHAERLVTQLKNADRTDKPVDPALPLALARARREADEAFRGSGHEWWDDDRRSLGLVGAGLSQLFRLLKPDS